MPDTIVLGLDGANWALLEPWLKDGDLPNIAALKESGVHADMRSELPPVTCPNWRCYSTGKNPGKLGVFWWERIDTESRTLDTPNARSFKSRNYWDYLNDDDKRVGVMNLPMTHPPFEIDGWMVSGGPDSEPENYAHPDDLQADLDSRDYKLRPRAPVNSNEDYETAEEVIEMIDDRLATFRRLLRERPVDVAHCTVFFINVLQHFFWRDEPTRTAWKLIDRHIGEIREEYEESTLVLMSDHGCTEIDTVFYANEWLEERGYLETTGKATDAVSSQLNKQRLAHVAKRLGVTDLARALVPERLLDSLPDDSEGFKREKKLDRVNWKGTKAIASGQGLIYVVDDDPETTEELISELESLQSGLNGEPIASEVFRREEVYEGPYVEKAPNVIFDQRHGVHTSGAIGGNPIFAETGTWRGENVRTGLFLADGPLVETGADIRDGFSITNVAPTVLASVDSAVPADMDGEPLPVFGDRKFETRDPLPYADQGSESGAAVEDRLEDLGYLE